MEPTLSYLQSKGLDSLTTKFGQTGKHASRIGFGCYRIDVNVQSHRQALKLAIEKGINLIDTSTNYSDGNSETLVGQVIATLENEKKCRADELILVTKCGYLQASNLRKAVHRERHGYGFDEVVKLSDHLWHCIHPSFIANQLDESLQRLQVPKITALLLHNPEYFFEDTSQKTNRSEFLKRIEHAFAHLEEEVKRGRIDCYGVSSNTMAAVSQQSSTVLLTELLNVAKKVSSDHHFKVAQFPFNLFESDPMIIQNEQEKNLLDLANEFGIATMANRPLNAIISGKLLRLASFPRKQMDAASYEYERALSEAIGVEKNIPEDLEQPLFKIGHFLKERATELKDYLSWKDFFSYRLMPEIHRSFQQLKVIDVTEGWLPRYKEATVELVERFTELRQTEAAVRSDEIRDYLMQFVEAGCLPSLSQLVLSLYLQTTLDTVLVGARELGYVKEILTIPKIIWKQNPMIILKNVRDILSASYN